MKVAVSSPTGLVPGFVPYPSLMFIGMERMGVVVVVREGVTRLSVDKDVVEGKMDVKSSHSRPKRWCQGWESNCKIGRAHV